MRTSVVIVLVLLLGLAVAAPNQETLTEFAKWISAHNVVSQANLGVFQGAGLGGTAQKDIQEGDAIMKIPANILIRNSKLKSSVFKDFEWTPSFEFEPIMVYLLLEKANSKSVWKPYLDVLPVNFDFHPYFWSNEDLNELEGTGLVQVLQNNKAALQQTHEKLLENFVRPNSNIFPEQLFSWDNYFWAYLTVSTRSWAVKFSDMDEADYVMVPLADFLNHDPTAAVGGLSEDDQYFVINATRAYSKGEQVFDKYGPKNNFDLLLTYGFALEENADNYMQINFNLDAKNLVQGIVEPLLRAVDPGYRNIKIFPNRVPVALLRLFRLNVMTFSEMEKVEQALQGKAVGLENELRAYRACIRALAGLLKQYPTTVEEDAALLERTDLSNNVRNAVVFRKGQKEIIRNAILVIGKMWENILIEGSLFGDVAP